MPVPIGVLPEGIEITGPREEACSDAIWQAFLIILETEDNSNPALKGNSYFNYADKCIAKVECVDSGSAMRVKEKVFQLGKLTAESSPTWLASGIIREARHSEQYWEYRNNHWWSWLSTVFLIMCSLGVRQRMMPPLYSCNSCWMQALQSQRLTILNRRWQAIMNGWKQGLYRGKL
jgi:hypothetical protein